LILSLTITKVTTVYAKSGYNNILLHWRVSSDQLPLKSSISRSTVQTQSVCHGFIWSVDIVFPEMLSLEAKILASASVSTSASKLWPRPWPQTLGLGWPLFLQQKNQQPRRTICLHFTLPT